MPLPMRHCHGGGAGLPAHNSPLTIQPSFTVEFKKFLSPHLPYVCGLSSPDLLKRFPLSKRSFHSTGQQTEVNITVPNLSRAEFMLESPQIKKAPGSSEKELTISSIGAAL